MTRAEEAAKEIYKDGIELFGRRDKSGNLVIRLETMVGILRHAAARGYLQAEKDLALTVEDAQLIWQLCDTVNEERPTLCSSHDFFTEVLKRYNEKRFNEQRNGL